MQPWRVHSRDPGRANSLHRSPRAFNDWTDGQIEYELVHRTSSHIWTILFLLPFTIMSSMRVNMRVLTATVAIASVATLTATAHGTEYPEDISLAFQTQNRSSPLYSYPTDLTREVVPVKRPSLLFSPDVSRTSTNDYRKQSTPTMTTGALFPFILPSHMAASASKLTYGFTTGPFMLATNPLRSPLLAPLTPSTSAPSSLLSGMRTHHQPLLRPPQRMASLMATVLRLSTSLSM